MRKQWKRRLSLLAAVVYGGVVLLSGCGTNGQSDVLRGSQEETPGSGGTENDGNGDGNGLTGANQGNVVGGSSEASSMEAYYNTIYELGEVPVELPVTEVKDIAVGGEWVYVYGSRRVETENDEQMKSKFSVLRMNLDSAKTEEVFSYTGVMDMYSQYTYSIGYPLSVEAIAVLPGGDLIMVVQGTAENPEAKEISRIDLNGERVWTVTAQTEGIVGQIAAADDRLYIPCGNRVLIYDQKGYLQTIWTMDSFPEGFSTDNVSMNQMDLYITDDGQMYTVFNDYDMIRRFCLATDRTTGAMGSWKQLEGKAICSLWSGNGSGYDFILWDHGSIRGWDYDSESQVTLVDLINSCVVGDIRELRVIGEKNYLMKYQEIDGAVQLRQLIKADPEVLKQQKIITVGTFDANISTSNVLRYNRENKAYQVRVVDYYEYEDPYVQLNLDIAAGTVPDIFLFGSYGKTNFDHYGQIGLLEDMRPWFEQDKELKPEDFLTNVFDGENRGGQWKYLPTGANVDVYVGSSKVFEKNQTWSLDDYEELQRKNPDSVIIHSDRETMMRDMMVFRWNDFVDEENLTCSFDSEEFIRLLEWLKTFPAKAERPQYSLDDYRNGKVLGVKMFLNFDVFHMEMQRLFLGQAEMINLPEVEGAGALLIGSAPYLAMSAQSRYKEAAWEFVRYYFTDEYQEKKGNGSVKLSQLEAYGERVVNPTDMDAFQYSYFLSNGQEVLIDPPTQEMADRWIEVIRSARYMDKLDNALYDMIVEETGAFFSGQKTAQAVAKTIQGRVWVYLAEQE